MHYLTRQRLHLSRFHPLMKALLSLYILSVAGGVWVASLKYTDRAEWSAPGIGAHVRGEPNLALGSGAGTPGTHGEAAGSAAEGTAADPFGDPFGGTAEGVMAREPLSRRQLVDIVHPHLFTVPLVLFVLGHLLHLTRLPDVLKLAINAAAFLSFFATFLAPFAIDDAAVLGGVMYAAGSTMLASFALLCAIPLWETWLGRPGDGFDALPRREVPGARPPGK